MSVQTPGPAAELIDHAAGIIVEARKQPYTAPGHWAGALWKAGMLVAPGSAALSMPTAEEIAMKLSLVRFSDEESDRMIELTMREAWPLANAVLALLTESPR